MSNSADLKGTYQLDRTENWDGFAQAVGMNFLARKMAAKSRSKVTITQDEEKVTLETQSLVWTRSEVAYTNGEPYDTKAMDGTEMKSHSYWENGTLVIKSEPKDAESSKAPSVTTVRELTPDGELKQGFLMWKRIVEGNNSVKAL